MMWGRDGKLVHTMTQYSEEVSIFSVLISAFVRCDEIVIVNYTSRNSWNSRKRDSSHAAISKSLFTFFMESYKGASIA